MNSESKGRTNYFKVKNKNEFMEYIEQFDELEAFENSENMVGFLAEEGLPSTKPILDAEGDEIDYEEVDILEDLQKMLTDDTVLIYQEICSEGMRWVQGFSIAITSNQPIIRCDMSDIYSMAEEYFGIKPTEATY